MLLACARPWALGSLALLAFGPSAAALDPSRSITQYARSVWRAPQALPHDSVTAILETRDGYLWLGTIEGLARFDGIRSVVFDKSNTPAFADNWIKALLEDRAGRLWIGTYGGGLVCLEGGRFVSYGADRGLPYEGVMALLEDRAGRIWAGTLGGGVLRLEGERFVRPKETQAAAKSTVRALQEGREGTLWIGTEAGLFRLRQGVLDRLTRADGLTDETVLALAEDDQGLWIGTERGGLNHLHEGRIDALTPREGLAHERVWSLTVDRDGTLWIGTDGGGLQRLREGKLASLSARNGLTNDYVWAIREDRDGSLWIGTNGGGLNRLRIGRVLTLTTYDGLPSDFVWAVRGTRDGALWIGTEDAGMACLRDGRVATLITRREGISSNRVRAFAEGRDGSLWIGGSGGLDRWAAGRVTRRPIPGLPDDIVNAVLEGSEGTLWIGTNSSGVVAAKDGRLRTFSQREGLPGAYVSYLLEARDGSIWVGTRNGVAHIQGGQVAAFTRANGLPHSAVSVLFEDPVSGVWVGTRGGLARIRGERVTSLTSRQGLHEDVIVTALLGDEGSVWLGGNRGLSRVSLREVEDVMDGRRDRVAPLVLGPEDGMAHSEVNGGAPSSWKAGGRLWFATRGGVVEIDPARLAASAVSPRIRIEQVRADGRVLDGAGPWRLGAGTRRLVFEFTALSFRAPSRLRFRHRLEGFDADWQEGAPTRTAEYTNLSHGAYRFHVIAANEDGVWGPEGAAVEFQIEPRLYERPWVRALAAALLAALALSFYTVRVRQLRRQHDRLERLVAARTAEIEAANARLAQLSFEDPLTGVANRRRLDEVLEETWRRACRHGGSLAVLILDADFFKPFNDQLGHPAGDAALRAVAGTLAEFHRRAGELVARYGGEEFAVLLPDVSRGEAWRAAESARERIEALGIPHPGSEVSSVVTVSVGVAWTRPTAQALPGELVEAADRALYRAKQGGRNRVESATAPFSVLGPAP